MFQIGVRTIGTIMSHASHCWNCYILMFLYVSDWCSDNRHNKVPCSTLLELFPFVQHIRGPGGAFCKEQKIFKGKIQETFVRTAQNIPVCWVIEGDRGDGGWRQEREKCMSSLNNSTYLYLYKYENVCVFVCIFAFFSAIWNPIGILFGTKLLLGPEWVLKQ